LSVTPPCRYHPFVPNLAGARRKYARKLRRKAHLKSRLIVRAFAEVPREHFLGPGPWKIFRVLRSPRKRFQWRTGRDPRALYVTTPDSHPRHLYADVLVGIVPERLLNNGMPSGLARWFDALELRRGDRMMHIGCGTGYYTAILAHVVGPTGHVTALEIDNDLAPQAQANLAHLRNVKALNADGTTHDAGPLDAIFVNAGATRPCPLWLDSLNPGGRLVFPLVVLPRPNYIGPSGIMIKVKRRDNGYDASVVSFVGIFPCIGAIDRDDDALVIDAFKRGGHDKIRTLRRDDHETSSACWLHGRNFCLSTDPSP
jgi:protein-L-isoaspartate(D-aspartate) O-methyltransferase